MEANKKMLWLAQRPQTHTEFQKIAMVAKNSITRQKVK